MPGEIGALASVPVFELQNKAHPLGQEMSGPGSHFGIHLRTCGISGRFYLRFLNRTVEEKQLTKKIDFTINMKIIQLLAEKPGERPVYPEADQLFLCDGAL